MKIGTKSLLFGCHQIFWHPITVMFAYRKLFRQWPDLPGLISIAVHDLGYWGRGDIDGEEGKQHPFLGGNIVGKIVYRLLRWRGMKPFSAAMIAGEQALRCVLHSGSLARDNGLAPSDLCWADKYSIFCEPEWLYLLRTTLSGEIDEFRLNAVRSNHIPANATNRDWLRWFKASLLKRPEIHNLLQEQSLVRNHYLLRNKLACSSELMRKYEKTIDGGSPSVIVGPGVTHTSG
jgi:hypothetical protein